MCNDDAFVVGSGMQTIAEKGALPATTNELADVQVADSKLGLGGSSGCHSYGRGQRLRVQVGLEDHIAFDPDKRDWACLH